jgi:hypothetical protein
MAQQVVTELVISADTAGADQFSQAMAGAEQAANSGVQSASNMNLGLVVLGAGALAALAGVKQMVDYVVVANKDLADMQTVAKQVGLTLADFQGVKLGGAISGLTDSQINSGLEKSASLLNDAQRNANSLSKELDANGISVKNANGQLISENQLLGIAADLIKKAQSPGDQIAIAQMLGFTKEWIPLLQQGSTAMAGLTDEARQAGAVIDDETVTRAAEFDQAWRKSSVEFSAYMKSALLELLPYVDNLIDGASKFIKGIDVKKVEDSGKEQLKAISEQIGLPDEAAIKITIPQTVIDNWSELGDRVGDTFSKLKEFASDPAVTELFGYFMAVQPLGPHGAGPYILDAIEKVKSKLSGASGYLPNVESLDPASVPGYEASKLSEPSYPSSDQMDKAFSKHLKDLDAAQDAAQDALDKSTFSKVAGRGGDEADDAYDRAINQIEKHTARTLADVDAVGKGAGAQEALRAEYQLFTAAEQAGLPVTQAMRDKIQDLAQDAGDAAVELAKAKVANDNLFGRNTAFLSQSDVQIASQLKGLYPDVAEALNSAEAAQMRFNASARGLSSSIESNLVSGLTDITTGAKSASQGFTDMSNAIVKAVEQMVIKILIVEPLMRSLQGMMSGGLGGLGITFGAPGTAGSNMQGPVASAHGNVFGGGNVIPFAQGGVVGGPTMAPMALFGEAGPEAIVPLRRGADGNLGIASSGGGKAPQVTVNLVEDASRAGQTQQSSNDGGGFDLTVFVDSITAKNAANPGSATSQVLAQRGRLASR